MYSQLSTDKDAFALIALTYPPKGKKLTIGSNFF
jgi:hypothetical protein